MGTFYFLGTKENNKIVNILRILLGIVCIIVAAFWIIFDLKYQRDDKTIWITIAFLSGFGIYQVLSGFGQTTRFIEIGSDFLRLKYNAILPSKLIPADDIRKIDLFPLNVIFYFNSGKKFMLRFGTTYPEMTESTINALIEFAKLHNIKIEFIEELF